MPEAVIFAVALLAGAVASVTGFGIGSLLTPLLGTAMDMRLAVAAVAIPHVVGTALRFVLMGAAPDPQVLWSFGVTSAAGGLLGALLQGWLGNPGLTLVLGVLLIFTGIGEFSGLARRIRFRGAAAWIAGALSGFLGGLVGNQGGIRSAALLSFHLRRDTFIATATAIGLFVDGARTPFYLSSQGEALLSYAPRIAIAAVGVAVGTIAGGRVLSRVPEPWFRPIIALVILLLGVWVLSQLA